MFKNVRIEKFFILKNIIVYFLYLFKAIKFSKFFDNKSKF